MVGGPAADESGALFFAAIEKILAAELDGGLHGFGSAGDEEDALQVRRQVLDQFSRVAVGGFVFKLGAVGEDGPASLVREPLGDAQVAVADVSTPPPSIRRGIFPGVVPDIDAFGPLDERQRPAGLIRKDSRWCKGPDAPCLGHAPS